MPKRRRHYPHLRPDPAPPEPTSCQGVIYLEELTDVDMEAVRYLIGRWDRESPGYRAERTFIIGEAEL